MFFLLKFLVESMAKYMDYYILWLLNGLYTQFMRSVRGQSP